VGSLAPIGSIGRRAVTGRRPTICLCMIVKNEAKVIERCLSSVRGLIDTWVISDTGSADDTKDLIHKALDGIPGELHDDVWVNFGHNRTLNLEYARDKADYLLLVDADMVIRTEGAPLTLTADCYLLRHCGDLEYWNMRLIKGDIKWRYEGVTHEYLTTDERISQAYLDAWVIDHYADGGSRADKFIRDARMLREDLARDPDNPRTVFYLAQTMRDLGEAAEAIELYERRAGMGGWTEEVYYSLLQIGVLKAECGDWPGAMDALTRAWETQPARLEACYELASRLRAMTRYRAAYAFAASGLGRVKPKQGLFVQPWVYRWGLLFEYSISAYWTGNPVASLNACDHLLSMSDLPAPYRTQTIKNREFAARRILGVPQPESG
jgi:glycosyltransferase involved in cell wall biosynthesis